MGGVEVGGRWQSYLEDVADTAAVAADKRAERESMDARKAAAQAKAEAVLARAGAVNASNHNTSYDLWSNLVPLGKLAEADSKGRTHAFAMVYIDRDVRSKEIVTKGRFFKKTELVPEMTDVVSRFGVVLYAGQEDASDKVSFDTSGWSITTRGWETEYDMLKLEEMLETTLGALPPQPESETSL